MVGSLLSLFMCVGLSMVLMHWVSGNSDGDALYALKKSLQDPDNVLSSWNPKFNPCNWNHVICDTDGRVIMLELNTLNLSGNLVPELGNLEYLQHLKLFLNNIQGTIPPELGNLKNLISLDLYYNNLSGNIPAELGKLKSLEFLLLNNNQLTGCVPEEITNLPNLQLLNVTSNNLCGQILASGRFKHIPMKHLKNDPRMEGASYNTNCGCMTLQG